MPLGVSEYTSGWRTLTHFLPLRITAASTVCYPARADRVASVVGDRGAAEGFGSGCLGGFAFKGPRPVTYKATQP